MMKIVVKNPNEAAEVREVEALELRTMQEIVGGYVQMLPVEGIDVDLWCNEEGKLEGREPNIAIAGPEGVFDIVVGTAFFAEGDDEGDEVGLGDDKVEMLLDALNAPTAVAYGCPVLKIM